MFKEMRLGEWEPGSGRVRQGEPALAAVLREAKEETGLDVTVLGILGTFHFYRGPVGPPREIRATSPPRLTGFHVERPPYPALVEDELLAVLERSWPLACRGRLR